MSQLHDPISTASNANESCSWRRRNALSCHRLSVTSREVPTIAVMVPSSSSDGRVGDGHDAGRCVVAAHRELARPGFPARSCSMISVGGLGGRPRRGQRDDVLPECLVGGPAVQGFGGAVPGQHRALGRRDDHRLADRVEQLAHGHRQRGHRVPCEDRRSIGTPYPRTRPAQSGREEPNPLGHRGVRTQVARC